MQQSIHAGWAGQRLQHQVLYPRAAGSNYSEGGGNDYSHGECQEDLCANLLDVSLNRTVPRPNNQPR